MKINPSEHYQSFKEFYPFDLSQHQHPLNKGLHVAGTLLSLTLLFSLLKSAPAYFALSFIPGYTLAWIGHFKIEKNRPATFTYPLYSFMGDFRMSFDLLTGKIKF